MIAEKIEKMDLVANAGASDTPDVALREVREFIADKCRGKSVRIYEAGGGSLSVLPLSSMNKPTISVVDIDEVQLRNNSYADNKILGDIQTYVFPPDSFDLVVCYNVIEHLPAVDQALRQFHQALAPGGLVFIGAPNPESFFGLVTKYSPHWFHVWFYRAILRQKNAGKPGQLPFRTFYHPIVSPKALLKFCEQTGFTPVYFNLYIGSNYTSLKQTRPVIGSLVTAAVGLMNALTFNRFKLAHGDYHVVLQKAGARATA
jgi:2-polyprenyl-3-methyl-5-hydroxy-6-metoxy-1,4-benzoquinol methylase